MSVSIGWRLAVCVCACSLWPPSLAAAQTFKIASWNIRSGHGISALTGPSAFDANTRCADRATPINAWGVGLPQMELQKLNSDPLVVALALQEAWDCAPATYFEMTFTAAAATPYHLWIRGSGRANCWCNDSAWIQLSDEVEPLGRALHRIGSADATMYSVEECLNCGIAGWGWQDNQWGTAGGLGADIYFATSGPHTIRIQPREDGLSIDQIVLSASRYRTVPPGSSKYDQTIVSR
jgi:hypothetical protein